MDGSWTFPTGQNDSYLTNSGEVGDIANIVNIVMQKFR